MNSKQVVAVASVVALLVILIYPAITAGTAVILLRSAKIENAEHIYMSVDKIWAHQRGLDTIEGWKLVSNQSQNIDLISLENSTITVAKQQLSLASYDGIRLQISNVTWVFNDTNTKLETEFARVSTNVDFSVLAGKETVITLVMTGRQEETRGTKFFISNLNATTVVNQ